MSNQSKNCILCKNWSFEPGYGPYSEYTPGEAWEAGCTVRNENGVLRWTLIGSEVDSDDWRNAIRMAETCPDFDPVNP